MSQLNVSGLIIGSVSGFTALWIVMLVLRPRGLGHPLCLPMVAAALSIGPLLVYLTFDVDTVAAAFSRREIESPWQQFWFSAGFAYLVAGFIAFTTSTIMQFVRSRRK
jgi:hypothetical protein